MFISGLTVAPAGRSRTQSGERQNGLPHHAIGSPNPSVPIVRPDWICWIKTTTKLAVRISPWSVVRGAVIRHNCKVRIYNLNKIVLFENWLGLSLCSVHREVHFLCWILNVKQILIIVRPTKIAPVRTQKIFGAVILRVKLHVERIIAALVLVILDSLDTES